MQMRKSFATAIASFAPHRVTSAPATKARPFLSVNQCWATVSSAKSRDREAHDTGKHRPEVFTVGSRTQQQKMSDFIDTTENQVVSS